jgi:hypothetical protein
VAKAAAYVSKSGSAVTLLVHYEHLHAVVEHGSRMARFHECANCGDVVLVTAEIEGIIYGALNASCMKNTLGFSAAVNTDFSGYTAGQKRDRWRQNWCHPITITSPGDKAFTPPLSETPDTKEHT